MKRTLCTLLLSLSAVTLPTLALAPAASAAQISIGIRVGFAPPALPVYEQPVCPGDGYLWTPGWWAYDDADGYYWVPGTWVEAPDPGYLWTPGWWGWDNDAFLFHEGYWGTEVGFYGGISYGFGYFGDGFQGGRWDGGHFFYNRAVMNVNVTNIHNVYNTTITNYNNVNRVSYNGGQGGIDRRPTPREEQIGQEHHLPRSEAQTQHIEAARSNPEMRAETNHGKPSIAATSRPGDFKGEGVVAAKSEGAPYRPAPGAANRPGTPGAAAPRNENPAHARDLQPHQMPAAASSGNTRADARYQKQQQKLIDKQNQEHAALQAKQDAEDKKADQKMINSEKNQKVEQRHQQQTQQLEQKHTQQQQTMQMRAPAPRPAPAGRPR
jgi:hypothetical protein